MYIVVASFGLAALRYSLLLSFKPRLTDFPFVYPPHPLAVSWCPFRPHRVPATTSPSRSRPPRRQWRPPQRPRQHQHHLLRMAAAVVFTGFPSPKSFGSVGRGSTPEPPVKSGSWPRRCTTNRATSPPGKSCGSGRRSMATKTRCRAGFLRGSMRSTPTLLAAGACLKTRLTLKFAERVLSVLPSPH